MISPPTHAEKSQRVYVSRMIGAREAESKSANDTELGVCGACALCRSAGPSQSLCVLPSPSPFTNPPQI